ncbi:MULTISPECIES: bifunctional phosphopantothenoylcysteine decarboxylase/phosphopantothenate--cysteine ligase CoaBC [unclassified Rhodococcus (in: high G+C Gram-positive bacteria)]|uniref:bifunctional phosphopantothenoylcysteine decarboxylase/phosphopantothenate--cysteine ligase CoaBC n=1 Tax=unclassified Rhodococcus (in: high G+C Gram-positive bacteria) TaxID=192944 RepID=UPI000B9A2F79|nr:MULTISPECIES: bifunctional phosphopantothenoylcysteine decarboxylase/phosphopantothenate--cysteine ligase CoaBC [unclassified Rhodococcus (in: high G+C Gram-positive bacteria)]OZE31473.1 bifunctional phosphopantothenoylcysteine decarboxylase/phosphopantothenate--cysteine ligase CoaBC [Rhodococcus sp. 05-2254-4]OZE41617.1 bifunctional phosphopantothenoylcysteine decarboxylase/phosphopantothenate--cysteine ligase CoaBC [Rhodococcus sp. 05-2254-3]OZE52052.1 bifunctional phosphopantothenoylcystei
MHVVVGVGGGIAAYKSCSLIRSFTESGHQVRVIPTASALEFVGRATFEALSGQPVHTGVFADVPEVPHVRLGQEADLVVVVPATADLMARIAGGRADDLLTATLLTARCPVVLAPAMHTEMWEHPATVANVATLRSRGTHVIEPASGRLTGRDTGSGRLPEPDEIFALSMLVTERGDALPRDLEGRRVLVSAGGTREPLDPVRFLGNRSSGKQGYALARVAAQRGAQVTLVAGYTSDLDAPAAVDVVHVKTASDMQEAVRKLAVGVDAVVMAAAVADFRPESIAGSKIKKGADEPSSIPLVRNDDILAGLVSARRDGELEPSTVIVGFAAETGDADGDVLTYARAKLERKGCDLLVVNAVGDGKAFEVDHNDGWLLGSDGSEAALGEGSKALLASRVLDSVAQMLDARSTRPKSNP